MLAAMAVPVHASAKNSAAGRLSDVAKPNGREGVPVDVLAHPVCQPPGTSAGSTSPIRRQPFDSSHVRGAATSGGRSASA